MADDSSSSSSTPQAPSTDDRLIAIELNQALMFLYSGELQAADELAASVYARAVDAGLTEAACRAQRCRAQIAIDQGAYARAELLLDSSLELALANGDGRLIAGSYYARARKEALRGQYGDVESSLGLTLMQAREVGSHLYEAHAYSLLSHCRSCLGLLQEARDYMLAAIELYTAPNTEVHLLFCLINLAALHFQLGSYAESDAAFEAALALKECPNYGPDIAGGHYQLAYYQSAVGNNAAAAELLRRGADIWSGELDHQSEVWRLIAWGNYLAATNRADEALTNWNRALEFAQHRQNRFAVAAIRLGLAHTLLLLGRHHQANATLQDAQIGFELFNAEIMLARTFAAWAGYHLACHAPLAAEASLAKGARKARGLHHQGVVLEHELAEMQTQLDAARA